MMAIRMPDKSRAVPVLREHPEALISRASTPTPRSWKCAAHAQRGRLLQTSTELRS